ncbi:MarR family winged helix-turn-helix transcriptional regulator [Agromyces sp. GXS1127]|uniref:MarR family winged helix-turn-helix transcriptional regulator n=1 Tax=Agromyces sp. GXS1127 TaxID=3424181 RepID=UPI003D31EB44
MEPDLGSAPTTASALTSLDLGDDFGWALGVLLRAHRDRVQEAIGDFPHGPRGYETMAEVIRGTQPSQLALANHLGIDRTVMTYLVDDLEADGLVERRPNPADRRQRLVVATPRGQEVISGACSRVVAAQDLVLGALDPAEREALRRLLVKAAVGTGGDVDDPCEVADE